MEQINAFYQISDDDAVRVDLRDDDHAFLSFEAPLCGPRIQIRMSLRQLEAVANGILPVLPSACGCERNDDDAGDDEDYAYEIECDRVREGER